MEGKRWFSRRLPGRGSKSKGLRMEHAWCFVETLKGPPWLERGERGMSEKESSEETDHMGGICLGAGGTHPGSCMVGILPLLTRSVPLSYCGRKIM